VKRLPPLVGQVKRWLDRLGISPEGMVVAVSGGPDSLALLRALVTLRPASTAGPLIIAHLNHQLRGDESDADENFVRELHAAQTAAGHAGLELCYERIDVAAQARAEGENLESTARRIRYEWLAAVARKAGVRWIATGHTADDQAETVLHRLLRGTGLQGLRGIAARRPLDAGIEVIRPLLTVTREQVHNYLHAEGQTYRQDSSNLDLRYTRNRIRHDLLPFLTERYNPAIVSVLCRLAEQADAMYAGMEEQAQALLAQVERPRAGPLLVFDRSALAASPRHLVREVFRLAWQREGWPVGKMDFDHWDRLASVAFGETAAADLPEGIRVCGRERVVQVGSIP